MSNAASVVIAAMVDVLLSGSVDTNDPEACLAAWRRANFGAGAILAFGDRAIRGAILVKAGRTGGPAMVETIRRIFDEGERQTRRGSLGCFPLRVILAAKSTLETLERIEAEKDSSRP